MNLFLASLFVTGCGGGAASSGSPAPPLPAAPNLYFSFDSDSGTTGEVFQVPSDSSGAVNPTKILSDTSGGLITLTMDGAGNFYVIEHVPVAGELGNYAVLEYAAGVSGAATPIRRIAGTNTGLSVPDALAVDATGGIYVGSAGSGVVYFGPNQNGNVAPMRTIAGASTGLATVAHIYAQSSGEFSVVNLGADGYTVRTFAAGANGDVAPERIVDTFPFGTLVDGITADTAGNLWVASTFTTVSNNAFSSFQPTLQEFAAGTSNVMRTITPAGQGIRVSGLQCDPKGNLFVYTEDLAGKDSIEKFAAGISGTVSPTAEILLPFSNSDDGSLALF